jgi:hypothetical protein
MSTETEKTLSVPVAGRRYFNLSRGASYEAAKRGEIPTIRIGRLLKVPVRAMEEMLDRPGQRLRGSDGVEAA